MREFNQNEQKIKQVREREREKIIDKRHNNNIKAKFLKELLHM